MLYRITALYLYVIYMPRFNCKDIGMSCGWSKESKDLDELLNEIQRHASEAHGIKEFTPELIEKVKSAIRM